MEILLRKRVFPVNMLCSVNLVIQIILFVSLCHHASSFTNSTYTFSSASLKLANDTSVKYKNQTLPTDLVVKSRRKRSVLFPAGSDLTFTVSMQFPIMALSATSTTFDIDIPFAYELPDSTTIVTARKLEDEHAAILEMVEDLLNKFGLNGKQCIMRLICELAESQGLPYNGVLGKALEALFLLDYGFSTTDRLYDYVSARAYGEHEGNCHSVYYQCPFSAFNLMDDANDLLFNNMFP